MHFWLRLGVATFMAALALVNSYLGNVAPVFVCSLAGFLWAVLAYMRIEETK